MTRKVPPRWQTLGPGGAGDAPSGRADQQVGVAVAVQIAGAGHGRAELVAGRCPCRRASTLPVAPE